MTIPAAPLPKISSLIHSLRLKPSFDGTPWVSDGSDRTAAIFSRGSMALAAAAAALRGNPVNSRWRLWVPEYFCGLALDPLRHLGIPLAFYPAKEDLSPNLPKELRGPGAFLVVHYFGFPTPLEEATEACRQAGLTLIEDAAHALTPQPEIGSGPWVIYSPRKLLALPEGGLLVLPNNYVQKLPEPETFISRESVNWIIRRVSQSALRRARISWHSRNPKSVELPVLDPTIRSCSPYAITMMNRTHRVLEEFKFQRRQHFQQISEWIKDFEECRPFFRNLPPNVCPYAYPMRISQAEKAINYLQAAGIPAFRWPDLPAEASDPITLRLASETVLLPIHQGLLPDELDHIRMTLIEAFS